MRTDTFGQLVDRIIVARLKEYHHACAGDLRAEHRPQARYCREEAERLQAAADDLLSAMLRGDDDVPPPKRHARFHDHGAAEGRKMPPIPDTLWDCVDEMVRGHAHYWQCQSDVNLAKTRLASAERGGEAMMDQAHSLRKVIVDGQRELDLLNQRRNELVQKMDELLLRACVGQPPAICDHTARPTTRAR